MRISEMVRMQAYQTQFDISKKSKVGENKTASTEELYRQRAEAHIQSLRDSGYLIENDSHKVIVPISDEVKDQIRDYVRNQYVNNAGWQLESEESLGDISYAYTQTLEPADRLSASWSVNQYYFDIAEQYKQKIQETNPNWPHNGSSYDASIFDDFVPHESIDIKL